MRAPRHGPRRLPVRLPGPGQPERVLRVHEVYCAKLAGGKEITNFRTVQGGSNRQTRVRKRLGFFNAHPDCAFGAMRTLEDQIIRLLYLGSNIVRGERQTVRPLAVAIGEGLFCRERLVGAERRMGIRPIFGSGRTCWPARSIRRVACLLRAAGIGFSPPDGARWGSNLRHDG